MSDNPEQAPPIHVAFVCVQNAGRSQMAHAFAQQEVVERGLGDVIELHTGGTRPADHVHENVRRAMREVGIDISERTPRAVSPAELQQCSYVITMGCDAEDVCPATWGGESRDWGLPDPDGKPDDAVAAIRDEVESRVIELMDELEAALSAP